MKNIRLLLALCMLCNAAFAQTAAKKVGLFSVDEENMSATLKVEGTPLAQKYASVFQKHKKDATSAIEWNGIITLIVGMKETDLFADGDLQNDAEDDGSILLTATSMEYLTQGLKAVNSVLVSPQKLDAFLTEVDELSKK